MNIRLTLPAGSYGGNRNKPTSSSTCPIVSPFSSPPDPVSWTLNREVARWLSNSACGSASGSGSGCSGVVRISAANWSKCTATVVRAGGICRWATPVSGTKKVRRADVNLRSAAGPVISWQGSVSVCSLADG